MVAYKCFTLRVLAVFVLILLTGSTAVALSHGETTETSEMNQISNSDDNKYVSQTHTIVLINNSFSSEITEINQYDTVVWRNLNRPKRTFVLVGEDDLWEDFNLGYGRSFKYTFNETGTFDFSIKGEKGLQGSVVVSESGETIGAPLSERETSPVQQEETTETSEMDQGSTYEENKSVSQTHTFVLINNAFSPDIAEIHQYDTVVWRNLNRPKRTFVLVSNDKLWEDFSLGYGRSYKYTFNETGSFDFSIKGERGLEGTVLVKSRETAGGAPLSERETTPQEEEGATPTPTEEVTPAQRAADIPSSTVLIRGSVFYPETLEINKGEAVVWNNLNRPKRTFTLISEEGLFENQAVGYGRIFTYTFNESGEYTFKLDEIPGSEFILTVK